MLDDWKAQIMVEMAKKINNPQFSNHLDFVVMVTQGLSRSPFTDWIINKPKLKDFVIQTFKQFDKKGDLIDHIFHFQ